MKNTRALLAIPLIAIAAIAIGVGMSSNVFATSIIPTTTTVDPQDGPNEVNTADNGADNQKDGETNDDHNSAQEGPNGDGDGEQKDSTESGK